MLPATPQGERNARRWHMQYADGLVREGILEFSRMQDVGAMRVPFELLRARVGSPLSLASIGRDLGLSQPTVKRFIEILQAPYTVFTVQPWHDNIARSLLQSPKVYFFDTGMVGGQGGAVAGTGSDSALDGLRLENAVACTLLKHVDFLQDSEAAPVCLHYVRIKEGAEIDFALSHGTPLSQLIECEWPNATPHKAFAKFMPFWPDAQTVQLVRHLRNAEQRNGV